MLYPRLKLQEKLKQNSPLVDVRQTQTADWQVSEVGIVVKCFNRFPIPKIDF